MKETQHKSTSGRKEAIRVDFGVGGILGGLGSVLEKLGELAETAQEISQTGEIHGDGVEKAVKGVYGFRVKVGLGDAGVQVEPFGNIRKDEVTGETVIEEVREPIIDLFEEKDHVLIVAEMPGIGVDDLHVDLKDDILTLSAERGDKKYRKEILLPGELPRESMTISCNNGVVEIKCMK